MTTSSYLHTIHKRLWTGGIWVLSGKAVTVIAGVIANAMIARLLPPEEMGAYFLALSLVGAIVVIGQAGLNQTVVRLVAESLGQGQPGRARDAIHITFRIATCGALLVVVFLVSKPGPWLAYHLFNSPSIGSAINLIAILAAITIFQGLLAETFRGFHDFRWAAIVGGLITGVLSAALFALLWLLQGRADLKQVLILAIVAGLTNVLIAGWLLRDKVRHISGAGSLTGNDVLGIALPQLVTNFMLIVLAQSDVWILGISRSQSEIAVYGAAMRLVTLVAMPLLLVNAVVPPVIAEMYSQGKLRELERILRGSATLAGLPAVVVLFAFALFAGPVLELVYGPYYRAGATVLVVLSVGQLVNVWAGSCGITLMMTGHQSTMMLISLFSGVVAIIGMRAVVGNYGIAGVATIASLALVVQNLLMLFLARKMSGVWTNGFIAPPDICQMISKWLA